MRQRNLLITIVDNHPIARLGLSAIVQRSITNCDVIEFGKACQIIATYKRYLPIDLLVLDIQLPNAGGLELIHQLKRYPSQVDGYKRYLDDAMPIAKLVVEMARTRPSTGGMTATALRLRAAGAGRLLDWAKHSAQDVFDRYFDDWHITMPVVSTGPTVWGVHPSVPGTGLAAASFATRHLVKTGRPVGGSGALTDAVRASFEAAGGQVRCGVRVRKLLVDDGQVVGVELDDDSRLDASAVVAACDPKRVFVDWLDEIPTAARRLVAKWRDEPVHDGYESKIDAVLEQLPRYSFADAIEAIEPGIDVMQPTVVVSPSPDDLIDAHEGREQGRVAARPTLLINTPSVLDPTMTPDAGGHVLSLEVLFTPYGLQGGWPTSAEPSRWLDMWRAMTTDPDGVDVRAWRAMTPDRYEAEFSMHRGHTPSYAGAPLAALLGRERELTRYRTSIDGLYLSGAATFPGAGVFGASGRNTADVVRRDIAGRGRTIAPLRRRARGVAAAVRR